MTSQYNPLEKLRISINEYNVSFQSSSISINTPTLVIDRNKFTFSLTNDGLDPRNTEIIDGIVGFIRLNAGVFMILITKSTLVGSFATHQVYRVVDTSITQITRSRRNLTATEKDDDNQYLALLREIFAMNAFYYSYTYDLTLSLQKFHHTQKDIPMWKRADERFYWNKYLHRDMIENTTNDPATDLSPFMIPIILGFVSINNIRYNSRSFDYVLISRRSTRRAGTRYNTRGIDVDGNVANFVETEQIVTTEDRTGGLSKSSYLQIRGSIPWFWRQIVTMKYTPKLEVDLNSPAAQAAFENHFKEQIQNYGEVICVNLTNTKGYEMEVSRAFGNAVNASKQNIRYEHFDFHRECRKMKFENAIKIVNKLEDELTRQGYFMVDGLNTVLSPQRSIIRTNCMDCLDRTNVVQALLARKFLKSQLMSVNPAILDQKDTLENIPELDFILKNAWADNADAVSLVYSGTGALKTDFTRTGKRTLQGALQDGVNSMIRYVRNNYYDGRWQDAYDLFLGNYRVVEGNPSPFQYSENSVPKARVKLLPSLLILSLAMFFVSILIPTEQPSLRLFYAVFWLIVMVLTLRMMLMYYTDFVTRAKLFDPLDGRRGRPII